MTLEDEFLQSLKELTEEYSKEDLKEKSLLIGASHFTFWNKASNEDLSPVLDSINFGIGGTTAKFWIENYSLFKKFETQPQKILFSIGGNDISQGCSNKETIERIIKAFELYSSLFPNTTMYFVEMFSSPCKIKDGRNLKQKEVSLAIKEYIEKKNSSKLYYVEAKDFIFTENEGELDTAYNQKIDLTLFLEDRLHLNRKGQILFGEKIKLYFLK